MPSIANIALQNAAAAAVTATALVPSAGDKVAAQWRVENTKPPFARTTISMVSRFNAKRTARHIDIKITKPMSYTDSVTSQEVVTGSMLFTGTLIVPTSAQTTDSDDMVAYVRTCLADSGVVACLKAGYSPT